MDGRVEAVVQQQQDQQHLLVGLDGRVEAVVQQQQDQQHLSDDEPQETLDEIKVKFFFIIFLIFCTQWTSGHPLCL